MLKALDVFWKDEDAEESNVGTDLQPVRQLESATQRSLRRHMSLNGAAVRKVIAYDDPVSRITLYETGGVPIAIDP